MYVFSNKSNPLHTVCKTEIMEGVAEKMKLTSEDRQLTLLFQFFTRYSTSINMVVIKWREVVFIECFKSTRYAGLMNFNFIETPLTIDE